MTAPARDGAHAPTDTPDTSDIAAVDGAAAALVERAKRSSRALALAVSGGGDSMVLLHAVARALAERERSGLVCPITRVLTFDHGTGLHATVAVALVTGEAERLGLEVRVGRARLEGAGEAQWRAARWTFLRDAAPPRALIATAHTRDDQIETVVMRALRGAGPRGLAGLAASSDEIARPLLGFSRELLRRYGNARQVPFVEDPANTWPQHLRNRIRRDLLPAIERVRPRFAAEMLHLSELAAKWRVEVEAIALRFVQEEDVSGGVRVAREELATYDSATLCVLWPAIAARARVTLDRRGTLRLAQFTTSGAPGARIQVSGGVEVYRHRDSFVLRRAYDAELPLGEAALTGELRFGEWLFTPVADGHRAVHQRSAETPDQGQCVQGENPWVAELPADRALSVRAWRPADRMRVRAGGPARRVKRFFGDAQVPGPRRQGWPVVLVDGEIVWIPGVRRTSAASERSGRPVVRFACERNDGGFSGS